MSRVYVVQASWWDANGQDQSDLVAAFFDEEHANAHARECQEKGDEYAAIVRVASDAARDATRNSVDAAEYRRARSERIAAQSVRPPRMFLTLSYEEYEHLNFSVVPVELKVPE